MMWKMSLTALVMKSMWKALDHVSAVDPMR